VTLERTNPEALAAAVLAGLVAALFAPVWLRGLSPFWGDMTYIHHPWQTAAAQRLQAGRLPLWDPDLYFGMPMAANMQRSVFYPGVVPFHVLGFATAAAVFHGLHYWLAGWLMFLWLRSLRLKPGAALGGAVTFALGGGLLSRMPFLNHIAVLSLMPALSLFFRKPALLALALATAFLAGYPPFLVGAAALAWAVAAVLAAPSGSWSQAGGEGLKTWLGAGLLAAALAACQLLPGAELMGLSRRGGGMGLDETLRFGYTFRDLVQWISPLLVYWKRFDPAVDWYQCSYVGFGAALCAVWGLWKLDRRRAAGLAALSGLILLLVLGESTAVSRAVWSHFPPLRFVRYPGNLSYLGWPLAALLAAAGLSRLPRAWQMGAFFALAVELLIYAQGATPLAPRGIFTEAGPLVRYLQERSGGLRYLISPLALESGRGFGVRDWKWRLYGLTNDPFRLRAAANFGEPLVPKASYDFMDLLYGQPSAAGAARLLPGVGTGFLLTPNPLPATALVHYEARILWHVYRVAQPAALAWALDEKAGEALAAGLPTEPLPLSAKPLSLVWSREDRYEVHSLPRQNDGPPQGGPSLRAAKGGALTWVFVAEPRYPGWRAVLEAYGSVRPAELRPAWGAFQKVRVPPGPWRLRFFYDPASWRAGLVLTLCSLLGFGVYWYNFALRRRS